MCVKSFTVQRQQSEQSRIVYCHVVLRIEGNKCVADFFHLLLLFAFMFFMYCNRVLQKFSSNRNSNLQQLYLLSFHETTNIALTAAGHPHQKVSPPHLLFQNRAPISCTTYYVVKQKHDGLFAQKSASVRTHFHQDFQYFS